MAKTAVIAADKTVSSNVIGIKAGQLLKDARRYSRDNNDRRKPLHEKPAHAPQ